MAFFLGRRMEYIGRIDIKDLRSDGKSKKKE